MPAIKKSRYVYVIATTIGVTKVGITDHLGRRMGGIRSSCPVAISLFNSIKLPYVLAKEVEALCHKELAQFHSRGEWFNVTPETAWACVQKHGKAVMEATEIDHVERRRREDWLIRELESQLQDKDSFVENQ